MNSGLGNNDCLLKAAQHRDFISRDQGGHVTSAWFHVLRPDPVRTHAADQMSRVIGGKQPFGRVTCGQER